MSVRGHHGILLIPREAPVAQSTTTSTAGSATVHNATMPATVNAGDLLVLCIVKRSSGTAAITTPSGWTESFKALTVGSGATCIAAAYWKYADGTEGGTSLAVTIGTSTAGSSAHVIRITGASGTPAVATALTTGTVSHNPPNLASGLTGPLLWIAGAAGQGTFTISAWPSGFTTQQTRTPSSNSMLSTCSKQDAAETLDPSTFTYSGGGDCRTFTIAVGA